MIIPVFTELPARLHSIQSTARDPLAVVGMAEVPVSPMGTEVAVPVVDSLQTVELQATMAEEQDTHS